MVKIGKSGKRLPVRRSDTGAEQVGNSIKSQEISNFVENELIYYAIEAFIDRESLGKIPVMPSNKNTAHKPLKSLDDEIRDLVARHGAPSVEHSFLRVKQEVVLGDASSAKSLKGKARTFPALSLDQIAAIVARGREKPWQARSQYRMSPFDWIREIYGDWMPGLQQGHIKKADPKLYEAFQKRLQRDGMPEGLDIPTKAEFLARRAAAVGEADGEDEYEGARAAMRIASRYYRQLKRSP